MRHSTAKGARTSPDNPGASLLMIWMRDHREHKGDDCLYWPYGKTSAGYGSYGRDGKMYFVHRYMCEFTHGAPPTPQHHAAHSCGNGDKGCVNPRHVSWKTGRENQLDRAEHKTSMGNYGRWKLTEAQVADIRKLSGPAAVIAKLYGVTEANIRQIQSGKTWKTGKRVVGGFQPGHPPMNKNAC